MQGENRDLGSIERLGMQDKEKDSEQESNLLINGGTRE